MISYKMKMFPETIDGHPTGTSCTNPASKRMVETLMGFCFPKVPPVLDELLSALGPLASVVSTELTRVDAGPSAQGVQKKVIEPRGKR